MLQSTFWDNGLRINVSEVAFCLAISHSKISHSKHRTIKNDIPQKPEESEIVWIAGHNLLTRWKYKKIKEFSSTYDSQLINKIVHQLWSSFLHYWNVISVAGRYNEGPSEKLSLNIWKHEVWHFLTFFFKVIGVVIGRCCSNPGLFFVKKTKDELKQKIAACTKCFKYSTLMCQSENQGCIYQFKTEQWNLKSAKAVTVERCLMQYFLLQYPGKLNIVCRSVNVCLLHSPSVYLL